MRTTAPLTSSSWRQKLKQQKQMRILNLLLLLAAVFQLICAVVPYPTVLQSKNKVERWYHNDLLTQASTLPLAAQSFVNRSIEGFAGIVGADADGNLLVSAWFKQPNPPKVYSVTPDLTKINFEVEYIPKWYPFLFYPQSNSEMFFSIFLDRSAPLSEYGIVRAFDAKTGKLVWTAATLGQIPSHGQANFAVSGQEIIVVGANNIISLNTLTGRVNYNKTTNCSDQYNPVEYPNSWNTFNPPQFDPVGRYIMFLVNQYPDTHGMFPNLQIYAVYSFDRKTGLLRFYQQQSVWFQNGPLVGQYTYGIGNQNGGCKINDIINGSYIWQKSGFANAYSIDSTHLFVGNMITPECYEANTGKLVWKQNLGINSGSVIAPVPSSQDNVLYFTNNYFLYAFSISTGEILLNITSSFPANILNAGMFPAKGCVYLFDWYGSTIYLIPLPQNKQK